MTLSTLSSKLTLSISLLSSSLLSSLTKLATSSIIHSLSSTWNILKIRSQRIRSHNRRKLRSLNTESHRIVIASLVLSQSSIILSSRSNSLSLSLSIILISLSSLSNSKNNLSLSTIYSISKTLSQSRIILSRNIISFQSILSSLQSLLSSFLSSYLTSQSSLSLLILSIILSISSKSIIKMQLSSLHSLNSLSLISSLHMNMLCFTWLSWL